jgi:flagellar motor protein MotB
MAKANEALKELLAKCGANSELIAKITGDEISDEVANSIQALAVFTKESALANPEIRKVIQAESLNGIDADSKIGKVKPENRNIRFKTFCFKRKGS